MRSSESSKSRVKAVGRTHFVVPLFLQGQTRKHQETIYILYMKLYETTVYIIIEDVVKRNKCQSVSHDKLFVGGQCRNPKAKNFE